jgi:large subunit ribosomal protein L30
VQVQRVGKEFAMASLKVKLLSSLEGRTPAQRGTIAGLGLKKINQVRLLNDTPSIRGMVAKVAHMIAFSTVEATAPKRKRTRRSVKAETK